MPDDTVEWTDAQREELRQLLGEHTCEPTWWPTAHGQTWTCSACGCAYRVDEARNMGGVSAKAIALGLLDPLTLGWRTA